MRFPRYRIVTAPNNEYIAQAQYAEDQAWYDISITTDNLAHLEQKLIELIAKRDFEPVIIKEFN